MKKTILVCGAALAFTAGVISAQSQEQQPRHNTMIRTFDVPVPPPAGVPGGAFVNTFEYVSAEAGIPGAVVKGAPYSATSVTETVQSLADGNRITHTSSAFVARDSEGRTRREQSLPAVGPFASEGAPPRFITINDPVAGVTYVLDEQSKTARKMISGRLQLMTAAGGVKGQAIAHAHGEMHVEVQGAAAPMQREGVVMIRHAGPAGKEGMPEPKIEKLGPTNVEGTVADGTRTTITIPAGAAGNERPIEVIDERWYSPELQTTVMSKHADPRMGETTFRLTKVTRSEPPRSLFEIPADYKTVEGREPVEVKIEKK